MKSTLQKMLSFHSLLIRFFITVNLFSSVEASSDLLQQKNEDKLLHQNFDPVVVSLILPPRDSPLYFAFADEDVLGKRDGRVFILLSEDEKDTKISEWRKNFFDVKIENEITTDMRDSVRNTKKRKLPKDNLSLLIKEVMVGDKKHRKGYDSISDEFYCYRTLDALFETMDDLEQQFPQFVEVLTIGESYLKHMNCTDGGYDINVLKLTNKESNVTKSPFFLICGIHPREVATSEACTNFAEDMLEQYGTDADKTWIMDHTEIHIFVNANPDGFKVEEDGLAQGVGRYKRKNMNPNGSYCWWMNCISKGTDLNRNFPHSKWNTVGTTGKCGSGYAGESPASEPETQAIVTYIESVLPPGTNIVDDAGTYELDSKGILIDVHMTTGFLGNGFFWPWAYDQSIIHPNFESLTAIGKKLASTTITQYDATNEIYPTAGDTTDWAHEAVGVPAYTAEVGTKFHEECEDYESTLSVNVMNIALYSARISYAPYNYGRGPDITAITLSSDTLTEADTLSLTVTASDSENAGGYSTGQQSISAIQIFVDSHPYDGATPDDEVQFQDSSSSTAEDATFDVSLSGLAEGTHTIHVQAQDNDGFKGPVHAKFFSIES